MKRSAVRGVNAGADQEKTNSQSDQVIKSQNLIDEYSSEDSVTFHSPLNNSLENDFTEEENRFVYHLSKVLKTVTDQEFEEKFMQPSKARQQNKSNNMNADQNIQTLNEEITADAPQQQSQSGSEDDRRQTQKMETNDDDNPQIMSVSMVVKMIESLKKELLSEKQKEKSELQQTIKDQFKQLKEECVKEVTAEISQKESRDVTQMQADVAFWKIKAETIAEVCSRMNNEIQDLTTRIENLELNNSKKMVLITGLSMHGLKFKWHRNEFLTGFFNEFLQIDVSVDDHFMLNADEPRPVVVILKTIEDKNLVLRNKNKLKDVVLKSKESRGIFINEYLPPTNLEKRKREQEIAEQYGDTENVVVYDKGKLCVNGIPYVKKVNPPSPKTLIEIEADELDRILKIKTTKGQVQIKQNSAFTGYCVDVSSFEDVNDCYIKMRLIQPEARHIVCAYWIDYPEKCYAMDFCDDGEPASGRLLLDVLTSNGLKGKAIFVARKYGGTRMGADRFICYSQAAKSALGLTDETQDQQTTVKKATFSQYGAPRSRARGRSSRGRGQYYNYKDALLPSHSVRGTRHPTQRRPYNPRPFNTRQRGSYAPPRNQQYSYKQNNHTMSIYDQYRDSLFPAYDQRTGSLQNTELGSTNSLPEFMERWSTRDDGAFRDANDEQD